MMKKIAICTLNSKYIHASLSPWCLKAGLAHYATEPVEAVVIDATVNQALEEIAQRLLAENYSCIALSCYIWNIEKTKSLVNMLKASCPDLPLIFGGPEVSYHPERILEQCQAVDFVLSGEGELPFAQLISAILQGKQQYDNVFGLSYRQGQAVILGKAYVSQEEPPSPYCDSYFQQLQGKISYIESSRGCPFSCAFCLSGREERVRYFSLPRIETELIALANSGTQTVKFVDRTFNSSQQHCNHILSFLLSEFGKQIPKTVCFHFEMAGDILAESTLDLLEQMPVGYVQLEVGMQSFCEKTLESVGRKTNIQKLLGNLQRLVSFGNHHLHIDLIAGLPYEDLSEFEKSFNIAYGIGAEMLQLGFLKVLQGSEIGENPQKYLHDYEKTAPYQVISTPWLSEMDFALLEKIEDGVDRLYNSGRFPRTLAYLLEATGGNAFALFRQIAQAATLEKHGSLEKYMDEIFRVCAEFDQVEGQKLRDQMVQDRIECNSTGILPDSLKVPDGNLRKLTIALEQQPQTARPPQGKRFVGILYSENRGVYVDYPTGSKKKKHEREKYQLHYISLAEFLPEKEL